MLTWLGLALAQRPIKTYSIHIHYFLWTAIECNEYNKYVCMVYILCNVCVCHFSFIHCRSAAPPFSSLEALPWEYSFCARICIWIRMFVLFPSHFAVGSVYENAKVSFSVPYFIHRALYVSNTKNGNVRDARICLNWMLRSHFTNPLKRWKSYANT